MTNIFKHRNFVFYLLVAAAGVLNAALMWVLNLWNVSNAQLILVVTSVLCGILLYIYKSNRKKE